MSLQQNKMSGPRGLASEADPGGAGPRPVILFDGLCDLCNTGVTWIRRRDRAGAFEYLPLQSPDVARRWPDLDAAALERALHLVAPDGSTRAGADALAMILERLPGWRGAARWLAFPLILRLARPIYALIARQRRAIACLTPHRRGE